MAIVIVPDAHESETVEDKVDPLWQEFLERDVLELKEETVVGAHCMGLIRMAEAMRDQLDEPDLRNKLMSLVSEQCNVWLFG